VIDVDLTPPRMWSEDRKLASDIPPLQKRGAKGNRTPDLLNAIEALYQLSYDPVTDEGET
jgi:hypothetical protein